MNTAFIGLDYIVDIAHSDGKISHAASFAAQRGVIEKANRALLFAQKQNWLRVLVKVGFDPGYADLPKHSPIFGRAQQLGALELGAPGTAYHPDLLATIADLHIVKPRVSAFYCTRLEAVLRARRIDRVVLSGISTTWAVQSTARDAHDRDYEVCVLEDSCAAATEEEHRRSIETLSRIARIITLEDLPTL